MMGRDHQLLGPCVAAIIVVLAVAPVFAGASPQSDQATESAALHPENVWLAPLDTSSEAYPFQRLPQSTFQNIHDTDRTVIPLPSGTWTGLVCLLALALFRGRKAIWKMLS